jgi:hypothetical protein
MNDSILSTHSLYDSRMEAERIRRLQRMLRTVSHNSGSLSLNTAENGRYDDGTREAVRELQRITGLPVTGEVDLATWQQLCRLWEESEEQYRRPVPIYPFPHPERYVRAGEFSDLVFIVQLMLGTLAMHYDSVGTPPLSGRYDGETQDAVREFQRVSGLSETGEIDAAVWNRLAGEYSRIASENP